MFIMLVWEFVSAPRLSCASWFTLPQPIKLFLFSQTGSLYTPKLLCKLGYVSIWPAETVLLSHAATVVDLKYQTEHDRYRLQPQPLTLLLKQPYLEKDLPPLCYYSTLERAACVRADSRFHTQLWHFKLKSGHECVHLNGRSNGAVWLQTKASIQPRTPVSQYW